MRDSHTGPLALTLLSVRACVHACMHVCVCLFTCINQKTTVSVVPQVLPTFIYFYLSLFFEIVFLFRVDILCVLSACISVHALFLEARRGIRYL